MTYRIIEARYAKGKKIIQCDNNGSGYKTREMYLVEELGGKWVHRSRGYTVSPRQAARFVAAINGPPSRPKPAGWYLKGKPSIPD